MHAAVSRSFARSARSLRSIVSGTIFHCAPLAASIPQAMTPPGSNILPAVAPLTFRVMVTISVLYPGFDIESVWSLPL